ncbi:MAG TPA: biotin carboxylase N-terminal domain-containing protein [Streptosporangiaceae bacterium]|nr:biotin carboxylase N-terminal domain-containing protein [Streptosporangiaceae bacterium]
MPAIRKLLIANRGEIALRIIATAREMDIATVAVFSDPDAGAPHVRAADEAVALPGAAPRDTYLRGDAIIAAAAASGADAVHPGYGFLAENAGFARDCAAAGLAFVGPSPEVIEAMGSKIAAKELLAAAGVPVLPGIPVLPGVTVLPGVPVLPGMGAEDAEKLAAAVAEIGYPVLVKASFGGGGRGMRIVTDPAGLTEAVASASREAASAFGDGTVFVERYLERPRHIEVQIVGDTHGNVTHLFERECSIQRRYQKIIEEAPSPAVDERLRAELTAAAVAAGRAIGYVGAGTVEFVMDSGGSFYFLEVNTRLQVEHPVTELITGLDLVRLQLEIAEGTPLPPEVTGARIRGHAIEARLCAEDPRAGFRPATGVLHRFEVPDLPGVRTDAGVADGTVVGVHYDSMLAKVIAHGPTRDAARRRLARALAGARLHGVTTNRDLLVAILREPEFGAGQIDTGYLSRHDPAELCAGLAGAGLAGAGLAGSRRDGPGTGPGDGLAADLHLAAAALAGQAARRAAAAVLPRVPSGWRNVRSEDQHAAYILDGERREVRYRLDAGGLRVSVDGRPLPGAKLGAARGDHVELTAGGVARQFSVHQVGDVVYVDSPLGSATLTEVERFPEPGGLAAAGSLLAPMPGTVVRVAVAVGDTVAAGAPIVVLEAMKMEHVVAAPAAGVVAELSVLAGQAVDAGAELARVEPAEGVGATGARATGARATGAAETASLDAASVAPPAAAAPLTPAEAAAPQPTTMIVKPFGGPDHQKASRS